MLQEGLLLSFLAAVSCGSWAVPGIFLCWAEVSLHAGMVRLGGSQCVWFFCSWGWGGATPL